MGIVIHTFVRKQDILSNYNYNLVIVLCFVFVSLHPLDI